MEEGRGRGGRKESRKSWPGHSGAGVRTLQPTAGRAVVLDGSPGLRPLDFLIFSVDSDAQLD